MLRIREIARIFASMLPYYSNIARGSLGIVLKTSMNAPNIIDLPRAPRGIFQEIAEATQIPRKRLYNGWLRRDPAVILLVADAIRRRNADRQDALTQLGDAMRGAA